jgi:hypothetical protein
MTRNPPSSSPRRRGPSNSIKNLLAAASETADRREARAAWVRQTCRAWGEAQRAMDDKLTAIVTKVSEEEFDRLFEEEQAKVDAIRQPLTDVQERGLWPRELYWGAV